MQTHPQPNQTQALLAQLDHEIARQSSLLLAAQSDAFGSPSSSSSSSDDIDGSVSDGGRAMSNNKVPTSFIQPLPSTEVDSSSLRSSNRAVARHFLLAQQARLAAQLEVRNAEAAAYVEHRYA